MNEEEYFKIKIEQDVLNNLLGNGNITLDEKYYHKRSIKLMTEAQEFGFQEGKLKAKNKIDEFYNEFDLLSNCSKDDKLFKRLWSKYFSQDERAILGASKLISNKRSGSPDTSKEIGEIKNE